MKKVIAVAVLAIALSVVVAKADNPLSVTAGGVPISGTAPVTVTAGVVACTDASASVGGCLTAGTQSIAGNKTFTGTITDANGFSGYPGVLSGGDCTVATVTSVNDGSVRFKMNSAADAVVQGNFADGASAIGVTLGNVVTLTNVASKVVRGCADVGTTCATEAFNFNPMGRLTMQATDASASPGAATINKPSGQAAIAASAGSVVITDSVVSATSVVIAILQATDATCVAIKNVIPAAGSFTINVNAVCTGNTKLGFVVFN